MTGWTANFADTKRQKALRLIVLKGQERTLHHQRDLMRRDLGYELQQHCRAGPKSAKAVELEERIRANMVEWTDLIVEIRALKGEKAA